MADFGGNPAATVFRVTRLIFSQPRPRGAQSACNGTGIAVSRWSRLLAVAVCACAFAACGVQAPPQPPRIEVPQTIKDLKTIQTGRTLNITFTMPTLATDGESLNKPVTVDIYRAISPAGQQPVQPVTSGPPWMTLTPKQLPAYIQGPNVDYPLTLSPQEFRQFQGSSYSFAVVAFTRGFRGHQRRSATSNIFRTTLLDVTGPVTNLQVKPSQSALLLTWEKPAETLAGVPPTHLTGYRVYLSQTGKPDTFKLLAEASTNSFEDRDFQFGKPYYFRVGAFTSLDGTTAESEPSATVGITPLDVFPPPVPTGLTAVNAAGAVDLLWNASVAPDLSGYNVYRSMDGGPFERVNKEPVPTPIYHDTTVTAGRHYQYSVTALDLTGNESGKSQPVSIATPASAHP